MKILELYSGIGGMHMAFQETGLQGIIKAAIEINPTANLIYKHNFPETHLMNLNIEGLTSDLIKKLDVDTILMSPPCQPFTRNGKMNDINDPRTESFQHILNLLPELKIKNILIENVKGFEKSLMRSQLVKVLNENSYSYQEFLLSPNQFGIPNSRLRYYCLCKKLPETFSFEIQDCMMKNYPGKNMPSTCFEIGDILENLQGLSKYNLPETILRKRLKILDICYKNSRRSCCFTKAYGRFIEGTGSVFSDIPQEVAERNLLKLYEIDCNSKEYSDLVQSLGLRFFTPKEISRLMCFPEQFSFPKDITERQKYMVLGNSVNVKVVSKLIKLL
ncbi:tRNA (cytosine(38)-C(5))-methyltransferase [Euwallacea similis]|uniref:tRNA (cytosine(38)-C(5))-methyltransferase n=1 Tax=Euwallacea similis TaxID=1736056 RepID=UPI00344E13B2